MCTFRSASELFLFPVINSQLPQIISMRLMSRDRHLWDTICFTQVVCNCWLPALNVALAHGLLHIVGKVHGCFVLVKEAVSRGSDMHNLMPDAQNER